MQTDSPELIITDPRVETVMARLLEDRNTFAVAYLRPDFNRVPPAFLADHLTIAPPGIGDDRLPLHSWLVLTANAAAVSPEQWRERLKPWNSQRLIVLQIGLPPDNTGWCGWLLHWGEWKVLRGFRVVAAGFLDTGHRTTEVSRDAPAWSRTVHAVGSEAFDKVTRASATIVGASRLGSLVAFQLASVGIRKITLVDPDELEEHNIVGMVGVTPEELGESKVMALARSLVAFRPDLAVTAVPFNFVARRGSISASDLIVSTVDLDAGRLAASRWATRHGAVHLDIGTGVTREGTGRLLAGDVRLFLSGAGCVCCVGGLSDRDQAEYELRAPLGAAPRRPPEAWDARGRLGSLPTLNALAASVGVQLWLDLLAGDLGGSTWHRLRWVPGSGLEVVAARVTAAANCPECRKV